MRLHMSRKSGVQTACCICGYHGAVGELHTCEREVKNAVGTYCGSKDSRFIGHLVESCHAFAMSHLWVLNMKPSHAK